MSDPFDVITRYAVKYRDGRYYTSPGRRSPSLKNARLYSRLADAKTRAGYSGTVVIVAVTMEPLAESIRETKGGE